MGQRLWWMVPSKRPSLAAQNLIGFVGMLCLLLWHTLEKIQTGILPEMLWTCHLASALTMLGFLFRRPAWVLAGGMFHLCCGLPAWLLEVSLNGTTLSSAALHLCTPLAVPWAARQVVAPASRWWMGIGLWVGGWLAGRWMGPALNINLAWAPYQIWDVPAWFSHLCNLGLVAGSLWGGHRLLQRML